MHYFFFSIGKGLSPRLFLGTQEMEIADIRTYIRTTVEGGKFQFLVIGFGFLGAFNFLSSLTIEKIWPVTVKGQFGYAALGGSIYTYTSYTRIMYIHMSVVVGLA